MNTDKALGKVSPSITTLIRNEHSQVMLTSHRYRSDAPAARKQAIVKTISLALEVHAQLEEEIFYPELQNVDAGDEVLSRAKPEHDEMRRLIRELEHLDAASDAYDERFMALMRDVMHHVADEETVLIPKAERLLGDRLCEMGAQWMRRKMALAAPHAGELARNAARAMPKGTMLVAGGLLAGAFLLGRGMEHRRH